MVKWREEHGMLHVPMAIALSIIAVAGLGTWGLLRHWRQLVELQLRLDRCVGQTALAMRSAENRIESSNRRMSALRASIGLGSVAGAGAVPALRAALELESLHEQAELAGWKARQALWLGQAGCEGPGDQPFPLPELGWRPEPDDFLGPRPLARETATMPRKIAIHHAPRAAAAEIIPPEVDPNVLHRISKNTVWTARWSHPPRLFGTGPR